MTRQERIEFEQHFLVTRHFDMGPKDLELLKKIEAHAQSRLAKAVDEAIEKMWENCGKDFYSPENTFPPKRQQNPRSVIDWDCLT